MIWKREEPGWYTSEKGGIIHESDNMWYFYPVYVENDTGKGPYKTLKQAKEIAEHGT